MALILNNKQPKILSGKPISVAGPAILTLTNKQPSTVQPKVVRIAATNIFTLTSNQPKPSFDKSIFVGGPAILTLTNKQSKVFQNKTIQPGKSDLILSHGQVITKVDHKAATQIATMSLSTESPNVIKNHLQQSGVANLNLSGAPPNVRLGHPQPSIKNDFVLDGNTPVILTKHIQTAGKASLIFSSNTPDISQTRAIIPNKTFLALVGKTPSVIQRKVVGAVDTNTGVNFERGADLTSNADSKVGIFSVWVRADSISGDQFLYQANGGNVIKIESNGSLQIIMGNATGQTVLGANSDTGVVTSNKWHHILFAWDLSVPRVQMYVDGVESLNSAFTLINDTIDYTQTEHAILSSISGFARFVGCSAEYYFNNAAI